MSSLTALPLIAKKISLKDEYGYWTSETVKIDGQLIRLAKNAKCEVDGQLERAWLPF